MNERTNCVADNNGRYYDNVIDCAPPTVVGAIARERDRGEREIVKLSRDAGRSWYSCLGCQSKRTPLGETSGD